jgi:two-component system phosphate regulon sensor histidine kinase PhoR
LTVILLPLVLFAGYSLWQVYRFNPDEFTQLLFVLSAAFAATVILSIILSINVAEKFTIPLERITTAARRIAAGRLSERVHVRTDNEIDVVGLALNHLASRLEEKLEEVTAEKQKLQLILEHMDNAVLLFDNHGCLLEANRSANLCFNLRPSMLGQHNINVLGNSQIDSALKEALASMRLQQLTFKSSLPGLPKIFQGSLIPLPGAAGSPTGVLAVFHDITSFKVLQERQADFVANASHELRTPLAAIRAAVETMATIELGEDPGSAVQFLSVIDRHSSRLEALVADLLDLSRLEQPTATFERTPLKLKEILRDVHRRFADRLTDKPALITGIGYRKS